MEEIIKNLKSQIRSCKKYKQDLDDASWGYETGVLLSANEAQKIVDKISSQLEPPVILRELEYWKNAIKGTIDQIDEAEDDGKMGDSLASSLRFMLSDYGLEQYCKSK